MRPISVIHIATAVLYQWTVVNAAPIGTRSLVPAQNQATSATEVASDVFAMISTSTLSGTSPDATSSVEPFENPDEDGLKNNCVIT
ncbi:hypothetical protein B0H17DRAFT_1201259 [Mycena rosella]|uniref:Uncharacterized protein n=1 Tax=Mycena rosella TaxID=1033263 RepID=A0AAD7GET7_MYCRO|nr:hypothetical protein B0H17DRAFT_1201259 [Mycena rosella]